MPLVQFEPEHKRLMARFKQKPDPDTSKAFLKMDGIAKQLAAKGLLPDARDALVNKLKDAMKKVVLALKEDNKEREKAHKEALKNPPENFDPQSATRTFNNIKRELLLLQRKAQKFTDTGGAEPPPPKLPELHFGADYKKLILDYDGTLSPGVVSALDRLDENADASKVMALVKAAREALEKQITLLAAEKSKCRDGKQLIILTKLVTELTDFRKVLKEFETRVFLIHRLKG